jgi:glycerol-3-phosphate O-acyltransferase
VTPQRAMFKIFGIHFSRWLWLFWPLRPFIRVKESPEGLTRDKLLSRHGEADVVYVLPRLVLIDVVVLGILLRRLDLPRPRAEAAPNRFRRAGLLALRFRKGLINPYEPREAFTEQLAALLRSDSRARDGRIVLQPVNVFFTRSAEHTERNFLLRSLFPDDENATSLQKLVFLLIHGLSVRVHLGDRMILSRDDIERDEREGQEVREGRAPSSKATSASMAPSEELVWARRIRRQLLIDFARERTSVMGPNLYDVNAIANWIFKTPETRKVFDSEAKPARASRKALAYLEEIAARYNYTTILALEKVFDLLWTRIFKGVRVRNFEAVAEVARQGQLIWMPCHRSHLDYMLLSYVLFKKGLVTPHIAAGVNLSFWPAGPVLRRGGAFFLRRSFSGNRLYAHVFSQYVDFLMHNSFPVEFFHEGGRSRIGKTLTPKTGLLSICVSSILKRRAEHTYLIPVYFGYDKVMEDGAYAAELGGMKKQKESVWQLLRSIRFLFSNYGRVDVSFGTPIHFGEAWKDFFSQAGNPDVVGPPGSGAGAGSSTLLPSSLSAAPDALESRDPRVQAFVRALARRVNQGINSTAVASGSALLTSALCAQSEAQVPRVLLSERVGMLHGIVAHLGRDLGWTVSPSSVGEGEITGSLPNGGEGAREPVRLAPMAGGPSLDAIVEEILATGIQWQFMIERPGEDDALLARNPAKELNLWWYRGTIFHVLAIAGLVATLLLEARERGEAMPRLAWLEAKLQAIRAVWDDELYWPDSTSSGALVLAALRVFGELGLATHDAWEVRVVESESAFATLRFLTDLVRPERELYTLQLATALALMESRGRFSRDELLRKAYDAHRSAFLRGVASHPAHLSRVFASRTFDALYKSGLFVPRDNQQLAVAYTELVSVAEFFNTAAWREFVEPG